MRTQGLGPRILQVESFDFREHNHFLRALLLLRELPTSYADEVPVYGFIAFENRKPIVIGFLRRMEGNYGWIDGLISNPEVDGPVRHAALDQVVLHLIDKAKELKLKRVLGFTVDNSTLERSYRLGFKKQPHSIIVLELDS